MYYTSISTSQPANIKKVTWVTIDDLHNVKLRLAELDKPQALGDDFIAAYGLITCYMDGKELPCRPLRAYIPELMNPTTLEDESVYKRLLENYFKDELINVLLPDDEKCASETTEVYIKEVDTCMRFTSYTLFNGLRLTLVTNRKTGEEYFSYCRNTFKNTFFALRANLENEINKALQLKREQRDLKGI